MFSLQYAVQSKVHKILKNCVVYFTIYSVQLTVALQYIACSWANNAVYSLQLTENSIKNAELNKDVKKLINIRNVLHVRADVFFSKKIIIYSFITIFCSAVNSSLCCYL